ncbi:PKD domain-containing protein [Methanosarcina barkeri]|uniref:PKD domain-containing protein n=1 Tax=Methanosarcina barkeri TaxID=2208 RepID=UPI00373AEBC8
MKTGHIKVSSPFSAKPVAAFTASSTSGKTPLKVKFTDTSTGSPTSWFWNFGDGAKSFHQNPIHKSNNKTCCKLHQQCYIRKSTIKG